MLHQTIAVSALAGSNKTFTLAKAISTSEYAGISLASNRILYLAPSIALGNEFAELVKALDPSVSITVMNSETMDVPVHVALHERLTTASEGKELVIATHKAYERITRSDASEWVVVMDEAPSLHTSSDIKFSSSVHVSNYKDMFDYNPETRELTVNSKTARVADLSGINTQLSDLIAALKTGKYKSFARVLPEEQTKVAKQTTLSVFTVPSKDYAVGKQFMLMGADCINHPITEGFYNLSLGNGNINHKSKKININFVTEKTNNSQYLRTFNPELYTHIISDCVEHAKSVKNEHNILLTTNKENKVPYTPSGEDISQLEWIVIGLNKYRMSNTIILAATQNISSDDAAFLIKYCGYTQEQIEWERMYAPNYQRIMRTCIRQQEELTEEVHIYVFSREEAVRMLKYFPNAKLNKIGTVVETEKKKGGRPVGSKKEDSITSEDRKKLCNMRKLAKQNYYSQSINYTLLNASSREIISQPWYNNYSARGKAK